MLEIVEVKNLLNFLKTRDEAFIQQLQINDTQAIYYEIYCQGNRDIFFYCLDKYYEDEYIRISNGQIVQSHTMDSTNSFGIVHIKTDTILAQIMLAGILEKATGLRSKRLKTLKKLKKIDKTLPPKPRRVSKSKPAS